jgi:hypothetical protein
MNKLEEIREEMLHSKLKVDDAVDAALVKAYNLGVADYDRELREHPRTEAGNAMAFYQAANEILDKLKVSEDKPIVAVYEEEGNWRFA